MKIAEENPAFKFFSLEEYDRSVKIVLENTDEPQNRELVKLISRLIRNNLIN